MHGQQNVKPSPNVIVLLNMSFFRVINYTLFYIDPPVNGYDIWSEGAKSLPLYAVPVLRTEKNRHFWKSGGGAFKEPLLSQYLFLP